LVEGDSDKVGAKSKSKYLKMETDEDLIEFEKEAVYVAAGFDAAAPVIQFTLYALGVYGASLEIPPITYIINATMNDPTLIATLNAIDYQADALFDAYVRPSAGVAETNTVASIYDWDTLASMFGDKYDGSILTRDKWDYTDKAYKEKPDVKKDEVPFLADPRDWYDSYRNVRAFGEYLVGVTDSILSPLNTWFMYSNANTTLAAVIKGAMYSAINNTALNDTIAGLAIAAGQPGNYLLGAFMLNSFAVATVKYQVLALVPDKFGYLWQLLWAGLPTYVPQKDFLNRMLKEFEADDDFDGDKLFGIPYLSYGEDIVGATGGAPDEEVNAVPLGSYYQPFAGFGAPLDQIIIPLYGETVYMRAYPKLELTDSTISITIEYKDGQIDPKDLAEFDGAEEDELKDWTVEFPYGDTGSQGTISCKAGNTVFWQWGGVESIPGYELTIILGVSALSIIGIIYVMMKKRKM